MISHPIDQVPLFMRLSQEERELVTARLRRRQAAVGEVIFDAGHPSDALYVIHSGWVKLEDPSSNRSLTLANLGSGSLLGEIDALLGRPHTSRARAAQTSQLLILSRNDLQDLVNRNPSIGLKFSATLGMRIAFLDQYLVHQRLRSLELLSSLSEDDLRALGKALEFRSYARGEFIIETGAPGDAVYIIEEGRARLISESREGESFEELDESMLLGHTAVVTGKPYSASVRAISDVSTWVLPRSVYLELIPKHPAIKIAFSRALAETLPANDHADAIERVRQLPLFSDVPTEALSALVSRLVMRHFPAGEVVYAEGTAGDALYVVESGEIRLFDAPFSDAQLLEKVRAGESFGEMALLTGRTRAECARAASDATLWVLYKSDFDDLMVRYPEISASLSRALTERLSSRENDFLVRHLRRINLFSDLASSELRAVSQGVKGLRFRPGEIVCFCGQPANSLFMIEMGEVKRIGVGPSGEPVLIDLLGPGDSFGEQAIVQNAPYNATAQAIGQVELWTIAKSDFLGMMEKYPALAVTVTRMMADRLSRTQSQGASRLRAPMSRGPVGPVPRPRAPVPRGTAPQGYQKAPQPRPFPPSSNATPPPASRIQRPPSGARPIPSTPVASPSSSRIATPRPVGSPPRAAPAASPKPAPRVEPVQQRDANIAATQSVQQVSPAPAARPVLNEQALSSQANSQTASQTSAVFPIQKARIQSRPDRAARGRSESKLLKEAAQWVTGLSLGGRIRMMAIGGLFAWIALITVPAIAISVITSIVGGMEVSGTMPSKTATPPATSTTGVRPGNIKDAPKIAYILPTDTPRPLPTATLVPPTATRPKPTAVPVTRAPSPTATARTVAASQPVLPPPPSSASPTAPLPALPNAQVDSRLGPGGLPHLQDTRVLSAGAPSGQKFWRVVSVGFEDQPSQSSGCGDHNIKVKVLDEDGKRFYGTKLVLTGGDPSPDYVEEKSQADAENMCGYNFSKETGGGSYTAWIQDSARPSDKVASMQGLPVKQHVSYVITFRLTTMP